MAKIPTNDIKLLRDHQPNLEMTGPARPPSRNNVADIRMASSRGRRQRGDEVLIGEQRYDVVLRYQELSQYGEGDRATARSPPAESAYRWRS